MNNLTEEPKMAKTAREVEKGLKPGSGVAKSPKQPKYGTIKVEGSTKKLVEALEKRVAKMEEAIASLLGSK